MTVVATEPKPIDMASPVGQLLLKRQGRLQSGSIFSAKTRIPSEVIHVRIDGSEETLCGRKLRSGAGEEVRWVWYAFGTFGSHLPHYADGRDHYRVCSGCVKSPVYQITKHVQETKARLIVGTAKK